MIHCLLIDSTESVSPSLNALLTQTTMFKMSVVFYDIQLVQAFATLQGGLSAMPVFYVATPNPTPDLMALASLGADSIVMLSKKPADAAVAYDHDVLDFLSLPLVEARLHRCLGKLTRTIQRANNGYADVLPRLLTLTKTQRVVLHKIGEQKTTRQIADELFLSTKTVDTHRANIRKSFSLRPAAR